jgi:7,8-dihydropterin-6-yl-methyl-4-(beta-D-ribofuranosyl)aminobenzene 5'-phosphate synthase
MHVQLLFDKKTSDEKLNVGWGVSFLVDGRILFDTGEKGDWLLKNMKVLGVDVEGIEAVVISHDHWDHTGGLWDVLAKKKSQTSLRSPGFSAQFKARVRRMNAN